MDLNSRYQIDNRNRWGIDSREEDVGLLAKKDQQIKRLQSEL